MIQLEYDAQTQTSDIVRDGGNIQTEDTLNTAILISLFTQRRANDDDDLPDPIDTNRRGYWADAYSSVIGDNMGSRLWLLSRSKTTRSVLNMAKVYGDEALAWVVTDGIAESVTVDVERQQDGLLAFRAKLLKSSSPVVHWSHVWNAHLELL